MFSSPAFLLHAKQLIAELFNESADILAVVLSTADGFEIVSETADDLTPDRLAAMSSSIAAIGDAVTQDACLGKCTGVTITLEDGFMLILGIDRPENALIINIVAKADAVLAKIAYQARQICRKLKK